MECFALILLSLVALIRLSQSLFVRSTSHYTLKLRQRSPIRLMRTMSLSSQDLSVRDDASAYHDLVSAAVDFNNVYSRNGMITATRSVRDIDSNTRRQFIYNIPILSEDGIKSPRHWLAPPIELPSKVKARIPSPSGSNIAILTEETISSSDGNTNNASNKRFVFEIWTNNGHRLSNRIVLPTEKHGAVCTDFNWFGGISWSPDETALVYAAEVNKPKTSSFFATPTSKTEENVIVGGQNVLGVGKGEDWGEKYVSTALLGLFCLHVETGKIGRIENVPGFISKDSTCLEGGYLLGQPIFSPCGTSVVYTAWDAGAGNDMPRRLGAIYCFHRPSKIYASSVTKLLSQLANLPEINEKETLNDDAVYVCITPEDRLARSPKFSNPVEGLSRLAYICNTKGFDTHGGCMALHVIDWDMAKETVVDESRRVVVDVVQFPGERGDTTKVAGIGFPGLFTSQLRDDCFTPDGNYILTTTEWGSVHKIIAIALGDGTVSPIHFDLSTSDDVNDCASQHFLCFADDGSAIVIQSEPNRPTMLGYLLPTFLNDLSRSAPSHLLVDMSAISSTSFSSLKPDRTLGYSYQTMNIHPEHGDVKVPVGLVLLLPQVSDGEKLPLIVVPHGGPHTCMPTAFVPSYAYLCNHGRYAILHVNFRGSTGFGQAALESLAGNAGSWDVLDVVAATQSVIDSGIVDPDRVGICGGSHGGFIAGHCIGQHPNLFKVAAMRNPCTNIASMVTATDIPDWCYVETLGPGCYNFSEFRPPNKKELGIMWDKSPIAYLEHVKAPTLIALGMKDRRVPPSQGLEYYHALRAKKVPTKLLMYDDCDHAIDLVVSEADFWINTKCWFDQWLQETKVSSVSGDDIM